MDAYMDNPEYQRLLELAWKRDLSPEEGADVKKSLAPRLQRDLEDEPEVADWVNSNHRDYAEIIFHGRPQPENTEVK